MWVVAVGGVGVNAQHSTCAVKSAGAWARSVLCLATCMVWWGGGAADWKQFRKDAGPGHMRAQVTVGRAGQGVLVAYITLMTHLCWGCYTSLLNIGPSSAALRCTRGWVGCHMS